MWQRFTERARKTILLAQEAAAKAKSDHVGTEHLLLALIENTSSTAYAVLASLGIDLDAMRAKLSEQVFGTEQGPEREPRLTPRAKRVLELAASEARKLKHNYVGTEHLLLALSREDKGIAAKILQQAGVTYERLLEATKESLGPEKDAEKQRVSLRVSFTELLAQGKPPFEAAEGLPAVMSVSESVRLNMEAKIVLMFAKLEADLAGAKEVDSAHLLLGLLRHEEGRVGQWLKEQGVTLDRFRESLSRGESEPQV